MNKLKEILRLVSSRSLYFFLGILFVLAIPVVYAAWNSTVSSGQTLTATLWNDVVAKLVELDNRTNSSSPHMTCATVSRDSGVDCNTTCTNDGMICILGSEHGADNFHGYIRDCRALSDTPSCRCCRVSF